jgi:hypothetical protein
MLLNNQLVDNINGQCALKFVMKMTCHWGTELKFPRPLVRLANEWLVARQRCLPFPHAQLFSASSPSPT